MLRLSCHSILLIQSKDSKNRQFIRINSFFYSKLFLYCILLFIGILYLNQLLCNNPISYLQYKERSISCTKKSLLYQNNDRLYTSFFFWDNFQRPQLSLIIETNKWYNFVHKWNQHLWNHFILKYIKFEWKDLNLDFHPKRLRESFPGIYYWKFKGNKWS